MAVNLAVLAGRNAARWKAMRIDPARKAEFDRIAARLVAGKETFRAIETLTGVPWWVVAVIHEREGGGDFGRYLGNGQSLDKVTTEVPKGRGPFKSWTSGAVDALCDCAPFAGRWHDWSCGGALTLLEQYNGLGYEPNPSPYLWSGTDQYVRGKYVRDHVYDPAAVDKQLGCAGLLAAMRARDSSIRFSGEAPAAAGPVVIAGGAIAAGVSVAAMGVPVWAIVLGAVVIVAVYLWWRNA